MYNKRKVGPIIYKNVEESLCTVCRFRDKCKSKSDFVYSCQSFLPDRFFEKRDGKYYFLGE